MYAYLNIMTSDGKRSFSVGLIDATGSYHPIETVDTKRHAIMLIHFLNGGDISRYKLQIYKDYFEEEEK